MVLLFLALTMAVLKLLGKQSVKSINTAELHWKTSTGSSVSPDFAE